MSRPITVLLFLFLLPYSSISQDFSNTVSDSIRILSYEKGDNTLILAINDNSKKFGFVDSFGNIKIDLKYDMASDFNSGHAIVKLNEKYGLIDEDQTVIIPFEYEYLFNNRNNKCIAVKKNIYGVINFKNQTLVPFKYDKLTSTNNSTFIYQINNDIGLLNIAKEFEPIDSAKSILSLDDKSYIVEKASSYMLVNQESKILLDNYDYFKRSGNGTIISKKNNKYGYVSIDGEIITECIYDFASSFSQGLSIIEKDKKYGFVNTKGHKVIPLKFQNAGLFRDSISIVKDSGKYGLIGINGEFILKPIYDQIKYDKSDQLIFTELNDSIKILNRDLSLFSNLNFTGSISTRWHHYKFNEGLMAIKIDSLYGFINDKGNLVINPQFKFVRSFENGYARTGLYGDGYGLINKEGQVILNEEYEKIKIEYDTLIYAVKDSLSIVLKGDRVLLSGIQGSIQDFKKNHFLISNLEDKFQVLDVEGNFLLPKFYDQVKFQTFALGVTIKENNKWGYFDLDSHVLIIPPIYDSISAFYGGCAIIIESKKKFGVYGNDGGILIELDMDAIEPMTYGILVFKDGKTGLYDKKGSLIFDIHYDELKHIGNLKFRAVVNGKSEILNIPTNN